MTKPGNSDPADRPAGSADPTESRPAEPEPDPGGTARTADPVPGNSEPAMAELEKAPPIREEPVMPTAAESTAAAARRRGDMARPKVLRIAFYLAIGSAVVGLLSALDLFLQKAELVESAQSIDAPQPLTAAEAERAVSSLLWLYLVVVVALAAFLMLFAYKAQDGVRRARMMALIITLIVLLFHFYFFGTVYGQVSGLLAAVTIALMYVPSTREYFGPRQTIR